MGSGFGSAGNAVASDIRGPQFESSHQQNYIEQCLLSTILKRRKQRKRGWNGPFLRTRTEGEVWLTSCLFCLDSAALLKLNEQQFYLFVQIQTSQTGD